MMHKVVLSLVLFSFSAATNLAQPNAVGFVNVQMPPGFCLFSNPLYASDNRVGALFGASGLPEGTAIYSLGNAFGTILSAAEESSLKVEILGKLPAELSAPIQIFRTENRLSLQWTGNLLTATDVAGPFEAPAQMISSVLLSDRNSSRFWRARVSTPFDYTQLKANVWSSGAWSDPTQGLNPGEGFVFFNPSDANITVTFLGLIPQGHLVNPIPAGWSIRSAMFPATGGISTRTKLELSPGDHIFFWEGGNFRQYIFLGPNTWSPEEPQSRAALAFFVFANKAISWEADLLLGQD